mmetsp:Transcript_71839/g.208149  ORF Transcript_71839/g.208149 Transcript_71839/m.208149 type:complete len:260 (+) Transcript_71839:64-843(+)|eukprot:CAMPEP_0176082180 /NCGR_PEP_ID=MMETSP0120_2-20121206/41107_1 /TAXON_ID=160619 /ORGANISM="Kryptoperidinium foliaceum, Strain CCMP 1326" /LENGTH=259 /DNA_ID=CAMNT_0017415947 /DNA_START=64 /DNA_END=843 /DNA_ORIENTATION=+
MASPIRQLASAALFIGIMPARGELTDVWLRALHSKADSDHDGKLSFTELLAHSEMMEVKMSTSVIKDVFASIDANQDGKLSLEEYLQEAGNSPSNPEVAEWARVEKEKFEAIDDNKDGLLDAAEAKELFYPGVNGRATAVEAKSVMKTMDKDGDGKVSKAEFLHGEGESESEDGEVMFGHLDHDWDGMLNLDEVKTWKSGHVQNVNAARQLLKIADADGDHHLTEDELAEFEKARTKAAKHDVAFAEDVLDTWRVHDEL